MIASPKACLGSICSPAFVSPVLPTCSVIPCNPSVTPSRAVEPSIVELSLPIPCTPKAFNAPENADVLSAPDQSSQFGSVLPLFLALSKATGPAICIASNNPGPIKAPAIAPPGPASEPTPAPAILDSIDPPNCPACSTVANGNALKSKPFPPSFINLAA